MLKLAIVEDDPVCARQLRGYVERYCREHGVAAEITLFSDGLEIAERYHPVWDVLLLDIEMPNLDGMKAAERIRGMDPSVLIIFITNMARFAIRGYEVNALDFVLKPVTYQKLAMKLRKAVEIVNRRAERFLLVTEEGETYKLPLSDIHYIEVANRHIYVHTGKRTYRTTGTLSRMEEQLAGAAVARCSQSYLVNLRHVGSVQRDTVLVGEEALPLSRSRQKAFLRALSDYIGGGNR